MLRPCLRRGLYVNVSRSCQQVAEAAGEVAVLGGHREVVTAAGETLNFMQRDPFLARGAATVRKGK